MGEQAATYWDGKSRNLYYSKVKILVLFINTFPDSEIEGTQLLLDDEHPQQLAVPWINSGICVILLSRILKFSKIYNII